MKLAPMKFWPHLGRMNLIAMAIVVFGVLRVVVVWQVAFERIQYEQDEVARHEFLHNANLAVAVEDHTLRTLQSVEQVFNQMEKEYRVTGPRLDLSRLMAEENVPFRGFSYLAVLDELGKVAAGPDNPTPVDANDRAYFKHHQTVESRQLFIASPMQGRVSGKWSIHFSRRINKPDGTFGGVLVGAIEPAYFTNLFLKTDVGEHGTVSLVGLDGIVRARRVGKQTTIGTDVSGGALVAAQAQRPEGSVLGAGSVDGQVRFFSYRTLKDYPLFVAVGSSQQETLAPVFQRARKYQAAAALATLTVLVVCVLLIWLLRRQQALLNGMRRAQAAQRASFSLAGVGMSHLDLEGRYLQVNDKLCSMLGCSEAELTGTPVQERMFPEDRDACQLFLENLRANPEQHQSSTLEARYLHKDGSVIWTLASVSLVLRIADSESYFISAVQDITERKQAALALREREKQMASAFENSPIGMALTDPGGHWLKVNRSLCQMLGYSETEMMQQSLQRITHPQDWPGCLDRLEKLLAGGCDHFQAENRYLHRQGHAVWALLAVSLVRDDDAKPLHFIAQVQDVSLQKQAEDKIARLNTELEERARQRTQELQFAMREITDFSYSMAHDLRQPLSSIMGFSDLLAQEPGPQASERGRHWLARIQAGIRQIGDLTDALLLLAKLSSIDLRRENVDLSVMAQGLIERHMRLEPGRQTHIRIQPGLTMVGDRQFLAVVMENLIGNAWKFSANMPLTEIEVGSEQGPNDETVYFVRDKGAGFDMAYAGKLFGNFQRLHSPAEFPGNGIGLASAQRVIMRHGGRIWGHGVPGQGCTFYFTVGTVPHPEGAGAE
ncbi:MAG: PAS domain S-box protein [Polaromonas sp.]